MSTSLSTPPLGATVTPEGVHFGVWAPKARTIAVVLERGGRMSEHRLARDEQGVHTGLVAEARPGDRYWFRIDGGDAFPDPRSRFQPEGVHGPSEIVDLSTFTWTDGDWRGITIDESIVYELHIGTYTPEGTYAALAKELPELKRLGVTAIELMPVAEFPGRRNWGYDGVDWFAPTRAYGRPEDLANLVDEAHRVGLAVLLDVVYNHFGPDGNYVGMYSDQWFTDRHKTPWGNAINYDQPGSAFVRAHVLENVRQWIRDYHFDGLRLDASDTIVDDSPIHIIRAIQETAHAAAAGRDVVVVCEEARNDVRTIRPVAKGGYGADAVWADDFHHELRVYLTNARENYYAHYEGSMRRIADAVEGGFLYQGQSSPASGKPRGTKVTDEPASAFVFCLQNHDQVGNRPFGERLHHDIALARWLVATALLLTVPETPMLFMGQEFAASTPFLYFTDHHEELGKLVTQGRRGEFGGFRAFQDEAAQAAIPDPQAEATFGASKLKLEERQRHAGVYALHRSLLALRQSDPVLSVPDRAATTAEPVGLHALALVRRQSDQARVLIANFGAAFSTPLSAVPSLAALTTRSWRPLLTTGDQEYGGLGDAAAVMPGDDAPRLVAPARVATLFAVD